MGTWVWLMAACNAAQSAIGQHLVSIVYIITGPLVATDVAAPPRCSWFVCMCGRKCQKQPTTVAPDARHASEAGPRLFQLAMHVVASTGASLHTKGQCYFTPTAVLKPTVIINRALTCIDMR
jgi:hypothetical protein